MLRSSTWRSVPDLSSKIRINISEIATVLADMLEDYGSLTFEATEAAIDETGRETAKYLREVSPKRTGDYAKGWRFTKDGKSKKFKAGAVVYNTNGQLTHLLENGHILRRGGRTIGEVDAQPHIADGERYAQGVLISAVKRRIEELGK